MFRGGWRAQGRVIFRAFGQYIQLPPPWSYIVVTAALYGAAALGVLHAAGLLGAQLWSTLAGSQAQNKYPSLPWIWIDKWAPAINKRIPTGLSHYHVVICHVGFIPLSRPAPHPREWPAARLNKLKLLT